jgi:predicted ATPase
MIKVTYIDGKTQEFSEANDWDYASDNEGFIYLIKRTFDNEGDYEEDEDEIIAGINISQLRVLEC